MIFYNETDLDEDGTKLTTDESKLRAIERLCNGVNTGEARFIEALLCFRNGDITNALAKTEQALENGCSQALSLLYQLKDQIEAKTSAPEAITDEEDDLEIDDEADATSLHQQEALAASSAPDASLLVYRAQQVQQATKWKERVFEKRREKWREKITAAPTYAPSATQKTIAEHWDKLAVNGRLKLAELWDQRIINLVDAIKVGDTRLGAPEALSEGEYDGWMSRRISRKHRLIYNFVNERLVVKECGQHYRGR